MSNNNFDKMHLQWFADDGKKTEPIKTDVKDGVDPTSTDDKSNGKLNIELIEKEAKTNEEFRNSILEMGFIKSFNDTQTSKGINTFKENYDIKRREQLELDVEKLHQDRYPSEDPKDKRIRQLELDKEKEANEKKVAQIAKHLSAEALDIGIKLEEEFIDSLALIGTDMGEKFLRKIAKQKLDGIEEGKNKTLNKHAKIPQTGDSVNTEIPEGQLIQAYNDGKITLEEFQRKVKSLK